MNAIRRFTLLRFLGLALLATCFNAGLASAQVYQGKFTLPFQARWGQATLPAGDYSFTLDSVRTSCTLRLYRGKNGVAMILAQAQDKNNTGRAELTVEQGTVRAFTIPEVGRVFQYAPHRSKHLTATEEREIAEMVPVITTGK